MDEMVCSFTSQIGARLGVISLPMRTWSGFEPSNPQPSVVRRPPGLFSEPNGLSLWREKR